MRWLSCFTLVIIVSHALAQGKGNTCTIDAFKIAQNVFTSTAGLYSYMDWTDPVSLLIGIQGRLVNGSADGSGETGLVNVCRAFNAMWKNLADNNINAYTCFDPLFIMAADNTPENAYAYVATMKMVGFNCGGGFYTALNNWDCIQRAYTTQNGTLINTIVSMLQQIADNPQRACSATKTALSTWTDAFNKVCFASDVKYYGCQTMLQFTSTWYPICDDRCYVETATQRLLKFAIDDKESMDRITKEWKKTKTLYKPRFNIDLHRM